MLQKCSFILFYFMLFQSFGQQKEVPFDTDLWALHKNAKGVFETYNGRKTLSLNGKATLKDVSFSNGTLEVDVLANSSRSFAGIFFRSQEETAEEVYLRMHKSEQPDAVQYTPVYHGEGNWQLYREHQAKVFFKKKGWNRLKVSVTDNTAKVFLNDLLIMEIPSLKTENNKGSIGIWALFENRFSNFKYTKDSMAPLKTDSSKKSDPNVVYQWDISESRSYLPDAFTDDFSRRSYKKVSAEESGLLPIGKYIKKPSIGNFEKNREDYIVLRLKIRSDSIQRKQFIFDYSDKAIIFLDQVKLFQGNNAFRSKGNQFKGHMHPDANAITLALKKGWNTLYMVVIEKANGWGFMGKFENMEGISLKQ